jgi:uroporphyrinogen III methyltransferase/synthase
MNKGKVYIIGVGPGDYKLITLKAVECISKADVIVYDRLVNSRMLGYAKEDAELVYVGKLPDCHAVPQQGINKILVTKALEGKTVARVKGGDPFVFGRGGEECESLVENGIQFEVVPGVTSSIAVPAYAGIPVTHRDFCSSLHIITGHERPDKDGSLIDYEIIARLSGTLVFLMGVKNLPEISLNLIKHGKDKTTSVAVIEKGTTYEQRVVAGTLEDIAVKVAEAGVKSPAVTVVGKVASLREKLNWFERGPLAGKKVIVTRAREQASVLVEKVGQLGAEAVEFPVIKIVEPESYERFDSVLDSINSFKWIVFTSVNGVDCFFNRMRSKNKDIRSLYGCKLCAIGDATADKLKNMGLNVDYVPEKFTTAYLLEGLISLVEPGEKVLLARADIASPELYNGLVKAGIDCEDLVVYRNVPEAVDRDRILSMLEDGKIDYITFTSSSTVRNFVSIIGSDKLEALIGVKVLCIGPVTEQTAREMGISVTAVADEYTIDGLVKKLLEV